MADESIYVTLAGLPLWFEWQWPMRASEAGSDWTILHGRAWLADGSGLHADVSVNLTRTLKEALPSLVPEHASPVAVNAVRKDLDTHQLEMLKSGKRQPVPLSSRHYDFRRQQLLFEPAEDEAVRRMLLQKVYWTAARGGAGARAWMADPADAVFVDTSAAHLLELTRGLAEEGWLRLQGEQAAATEKLLGEAQAMKSALQLALEELEKKHAFERG
ncbi:MAG TPA: hypothetical protein VEG08_02215 [Terriglobales bacterium]|nr:hypothetical protein [Terriglobales bacterium]